MFLAVDVDEATRGQIGHISASLREPIEKYAKASWVRPDRMHLTLQFFGNADAAEEQRILAALAEPIRERPFQLSFGGIGCFPEHGSPRVLWLGIHDGLSELHRVWQVLDLRLDVASGRDGRFTPHLTLARFKGRAPRGTRPKMADFRADAGPSRIDRVTLYESRLSPAGPTYLALARAPLSRTD